MFQALTGLLVSRNELNARNDTLIIPHQWKPEEPVRTNCLFMREFYKSCLNQINLLNHSCSAGRMELLEYHKRFNATIFLHVYVIQGGPKSDISRTM